MTIGCAPPAPPPRGSTATTTGTPDYFDNTGRADVLSGGVRMIPVTTPKGTFKVHYVDHILRMPPDQWPDPANRGFAKINHDVYVLMQGPSEMGASGRLEKWDRTADLAKITVSRPS